MHIDFNVKHENIFHKGVEFLNCNLIKKIKILITYPWPWCFVLMTNSRGVMKESSDFKSGCGGSHHLC
jgi:hypothetical protein